MLAPLRRRHARKHCLGVRIGLANGATPWGISACENRLVGPGRPDVGPPSPAPPKLRAMTADPVAQIQSSNTVPAVSVDAILGIRGLHVSSAVGRQDALIGSPPRPRSHLDPPSPSPS